MHYTFDTEIAKEYGVNEAIMIANLQFWIMKNKANDINNFDGHYWTYDSNKALQELFPFWSEKTIRTTLEHLKASGVLITGNYNKSPYDRTLWYAFADERKWICQNGKIHLPISANGNAEIGKAIPDNKPNNITNSSSSIKNTLFDDLPNPIPQPTDLCNKMQNTWNKFCDTVKRNTHKCRVLSPKNIKKMKEILKQAEKFRLQDGSEKELIQYIFEDIIAPVYENNDFLNGNKITKNYENPFPLSIDYILDIEKFIKMYNEKSCLQNR